MCMNRHAAAGKTVDEEDLAAQAVIGADNTREAMITSTLEKKGMACAVNDSQQDMSQLHCMCKKQKKV